MTRPHDRQAAGAPPVHAPWAPRAVAALLGLAAIAAPARAQQVIGHFPPAPDPRRVTSTNQVTVPSFFEHAPGGLQRIPGNPCNPGDCWTGPVVVKANQGYRLQVRLTGTPAEPTSYTVQLTDNAAPYGNRRAVTTGAWVDVATGPATAGQSLTVTYFVRKIGGPPAQPAEVSGLLAYRVIATP